MKYHTSNVPINSFTIDCGIPPLAGFYSKLNVLLILLLQERSIIVITSFI